MLDFVIGVLVAPILYAAVLVCIGVTIGIIKTILKEIKKG